MENFIFEKDVCPVAKMGDSYYLLILKKDRDRKGPGVISVTIDLDKMKIGSPIDILSHLKFNPWNPVKDSSEHERVLQLIKQKLDKQTIIEKIINPLHVMKEKVYVSKQLTSLQEFYPSFANVLKYENIDIVELPNTNDIWCRDFMPVKSADGRNILFNYNPSYLQQKWQHLITPRENIINILNDLNIEYDPVSDINLDGGNVVQCQNKVIITDAIYRENGIKKDDKSGQNEMIKRLKHHFKASVIIIPHQADDTLSHSDGVVRFLNEKTVLVNSFSSMFNTKLEESKHYLDNFYGALGKAGLDIIQVPYAPVDLKGEDGIPVATGLYINYLETKNCVFIPQFNSNKEKDEEALKVFTDLYQAENKVVIPVDSQIIANKGGVLNCVTWN